MKKKILLMLAMISLMACIFVIGINAATVYRDGDGNELFSYEVDSNNIITSYEGAFPKEDDDGNALTWYVIATATEGEDTVKTVSSFITTDSSFSTVSESGVYSYKGIDRAMVVSANFPEGITELNLDRDTYGWQTSSRNLLFIYFPSTMSEMESRLCQETPVITCEFHKDSTFDTIGNTAFYNCKNLREIFIPDSVTTIGGFESYKNQGSAFYNCVSLTRVTFENAESDLVINEDGTSNALTLNGGTFACCTALTSITLPNRTISVGPRAFEYDNALVEIRFGSALEESVGISIVHCCPSMKYYYVPSTWTTVCNHTFSKDGGYGPNDRVFFYAGTKEQLDAFISAAIASGNNHRLTDIKEANIIKWDPTKSDDYYKELATSNNSGYIVYEYDSCKAFYGNNHIESIVFSYESYSQPGAKITGCTRSNCFHNEAEELAPLFTCLGYSAPEDGRGGIAIGFTVNNAAIKKYEEGTSKTLKYGVFTVLQSKLGDNDVFGEDGTAASGVLSADITHSKLKAFELKVVGLTDEQKDIKLAMGAYVAVTDGEATEYSYMQEGEPDENEKYSFVSYNDIV